MKFAMIAQAVTMILTFVSKPVIIHLAGIEAHSINSLFTQVRNIARVKVVVRGKAPEVQKENF